MHGLKNNVWFQFGLGLLVSVVLIVVWFLPMNYHVIIGDDLKWVKAYNAGYTSSGFWQSILTMGTEGGKFRPVSNALILASTEACQSNFDCYVYINYAILALNAFLVALAAFQLSSRWWPVIFLASITLIVSRFAYFAILQIMGLMENLSLTWTILFMIAGVKFLRTSRVKWLVLLIAFYSLAFVSHERFMFLIVPLGAVLLWHGRRLGRLKLLAAIATVLVLTAIYLITKQFVFHTSVFTGSGATGGASILDTFRFSTFLGFVGQGILNLIGFNTGPATLSGEYFLDAGLGGILVGVFLSGTLGVLIYVLARQKPRTYGTSDTGIFLFLLLTIGVLLASSAITPRQEYRWFYAPFAGLILLVCLLLGHVSNRKVRSALLVLLALAFVSVDLFYKPFNLSNLYFEWSSRMAGSVKSGIIDRIRSSGPSPEDLYIITNGNENIQGWILADDYFFKLYSNNPKIDVHYINDIQLLPTNASLPGTALVFAISDTNVERIKWQDVRDSLLQKRSGASTATPEYSFMDHFALGKVPPGTPLGIPPSRAPFLSTLQNDTGGPVQAITLDIPSALRFRAINCQPGSHLIFSAAMPGSGDGSANLYVDIRKQGVTSRLADVSLRPSGANSTVTWLDYDIPMPGCTGEPIDFVFGARGYKRIQVGNTIVLTNVQLVSER